MTKINMMWCIVAIGVLLSVPQTAVQAGNLGLDYLGGVSLQEKILPLSDAVPRDRYVLDTKLVSLSALNASGELDVAAGTKCCGTDQAHGLEILDRISGITDPILGLGAVDRPYNGTLQAALIER